MCEIKSPAVREHAALYQPVRRQVYAVLDSPLSTWANTSKQERAAVKLICVSCDLKPGVQNDSWKASSDLCLLPCCFSASILPQKRKNQQSPNHSCSSSSCEKSTAGGFCSTAHPFFYNHGLVQGFAHGDESLDTMAGSAWE